MASPSGPHFPSVPEGNELFGSPKGLLPGIFLRALFHTVPRSSLGTPNSVQVAVTGQSWYVTGNLFAILVL